MMDFIGAHMTFLYLYLIYKFALWVAGFLFIAYLVNKKLKRFNDKFFKWTIFICIFLFIMVAIAGPSYEPPWHSRNKNYETGVIQIVHNNNNIYLAYEGFQRAQRFDEQALEAQWCLPYIDLTEYISYYTGSIEDNIRALEPTLNNEKINEIAESVDSVTSVSYLYKFMDYDILVVDTYADGTVLISMNADFNWKNDRAGLYWENRGDPVYYKYLSTDLYRDLLDALINIEPEHLPDSQTLGSKESLEYIKYTQPMFGKSSLEYINVTIGGVSFSAHGYRKIDENSIFGDTIEDAILEILDQADEDENQISYEEFWVSIAPKHEEVGNTSLTYCNWLYYYYGYNRKSAL